MSTELLASVDVGNPLADPFGNGFCLIEFLGRGYDEVATPPS